MVTNDPAGIEEATLSGDGTVVWASTFAGRLLWIQVDTSRFPDPGCTRIPCAVDRPRLVFSTGEFRSPSGHRTIRSATARRWDTSPAALCLSNGDRISGSLGDARKTHSHAGAHPIAL
jgi:hypothetical protein